jgi:hypothetical protein
LREAIATTGDGDLIRFASPLFDNSQTMTLDGTFLDLTKSVTIEGPGADLLSISGNFTSRVLRALGNFSVTLKGVTIRDGFAENGAGILSSARLALQGVAVTGNRATDSASNGFGGGVSLTGSGNFVGCTFSDNSADDTGGAIFFGQSGQQSIQLLRLGNTTISGNRAFRGGAVGVFSVVHNSTMQVNLVDGTLVENSVPRNVAAYDNPVGGFFAYADTLNGAYAVVNVRNTIIANNDGANLQTGVGGGPITVNSLGYNLTNDATSAYLTEATDLLGVDPRLGPLNNNGGRVETRALLGGSPALDAGQISGYSKDARGVSRSFDALGAPGVPGDRSDIGAAEMHALFVTNTDDAGPGSLRDAMDIQNNDGPGLDDILFDPNVFGATPRTINLAGPLPDNGSGLSIHGPGAKLLTIRRDTGGNYRIFYSLGAALAISGVTISNGSTYLRGGGIYANFTRLSLADVAVTGNSTTSAVGGGGLALDGADGTIKNSTFSGNSSNNGFGGGIYFEGNPYYDLTNMRLRVTNTTVTGNSAGFGGGISVLANGAVGATLELTHSTIAGNESPADGGIDVYAYEAGALAQVRPRNTIIANNSLPNIGTGSAYGGSSSVVSLGHNLCSGGEGANLDRPSDRNNTNPMLGPLGDYSGATQTLSLLAGSPAIDAGDGSGANRDQRGLARPIDFADQANASDGADIGAFEYQDEIFGDTFGG